jgi:hypothetical protein
MILLRSGVVSLIVFFAPPSYAESKRGRVGFVPLDGLDGAIDHSGSGARSTGAQGDH